MTIPKPLEPFSNFRQFITYTTRQSAKPGKTDKLPVDWRTGRVADAQDPAIWTDYDTAFANGNGAVGFVFTDHDPFWFLDIDNCLLPSGWSPLARELCALLPGAAVEVSLSGRGLHLFGTGKVPKHACRGPAGSGLEFYHTGRFVAFGNQPNITGSAATDCTTGLEILVDRYFKREIVDEQPLPEWSAMPVPEWRGPLEDTELIRRACASRSASGVFGSRATFEQLWLADTEALTRAYPAEGREYDASSADAALAQHLAFWTGKNCERMQALMMKSALRRDKWEREDYLPRTIRQAVAKQIVVCQDKPVDTEVTIKARDVSGETYLNADQQKIMFDGCVYIADVNKILMPGGHQYKPEQFDNMLGGFTYVLEADNSKTTKSAWEAFTRSRVVRFPKAHTGAFRPDKSPGEIWKQGNALQVNTYAPIQVDMRKGNPRPFLDHLARILPDQNDQAILLAYMAACVQHKGIKFQWAPLIQGAPGNGKTLLSRCVVEAIGKDHCHTPKTEELTSRFNDWLEGRIFIAVEDVYVPKEKQEIIEALKPMITSDWLELEGKNKDKVSRYVCANFMLNSNHKDALRKTKDDRRFAVFYCAQQSHNDIVRDGMGDEYFPRLYNWLRRDGYAIVADYLANYAIPNELNPALECHRAPITSSTNEAISESMGTIEQEIVAAQLEDRVGFRNGWVSSYYLTMLIKDFGARIPRNKRRGILEDMGMIPHPGLHRGQTNNTCHPDMCKPVLYVTPNHYSINLKGSEVATAYERDQLDGVGKIRQVVG